MNIPSILRDSVQVRWKNYRKIMKMPNKKKILEQFLVEKNIDATIEYDPHYHSWMIICHNSPDGTQKDKAGNFWAAIELMDVIAKFDLRRIRKSESKRLPQKEKET